MMMSKTNSRAPLLDSAEYIIFGISSLFYIVNLVSNCYVSYHMYQRQQMEWFATSSSLIALFYLFTQVFSHIFFTYNNVADRDCSPYLQHINAKSGEEDGQISKKEFLEIHHQAVCPHSKFSDRLWTEKNLADLKTTHINICQKICSQVVSVVLHLLHIGPVLRYIQLLKFRQREMNTRPSEEEDMEEKKIKDIEKYFCKLCLLDRASDYSLRDITLLRLFEAMEAAPQVLLQLYLVFYVQVFSSLLLVPAALGTLHMSLSLGLSMKYQRMPRKDSFNQTVVGLVCVTCYKVFLIASRMICLAVFASLYRGYFILFLFAHSLVMLLWILYLDSSFSSTNSEEVVFNFTVAMLKAFTFVNVSPGASRNRVIGYHICLLLENAAMSVFWYYKTLEEFDHGLNTVASVAGFYVAGVAVKILYYTCCHPSKLQNGTPRKGTDLSVMYKNKGGSQAVLNHPGMKDNAYLLKHDENSDAIHLPTSTPGSTWMLGFIESNPGSLSMNRRLVPNAVNRSRYNYDTYQSLHGMDSCSGYDSEVASILSSKNPIYENLPMSTHIRGPHPASSLAALQHPISSLQHPISSLQHPISSLQHPISSLQHPISSIQHPISSLHHPISSLHHPISSLQQQHPVLLPHHPPPVLPIQQPVLHPRQQQASGGGVIWQPPSSGRASAEQPNNNDSLSSSGVYSEEERKLNLKARLESEYDNLEESMGAAEPSSCASPDSDNGDIYENIPNVIRQGQQVHSDGLTMQSISLQGTADPRFEEGGQSRWGEMLQSSLNFAYGPADSSSEYTSLREVGGGGGAKEGGRPVAPLRTTSTVKHSDSQHSISTDV